MQALLDQGGYDMPQRGDIREGTVLSVTPQEIIIDLGLKREGIVPANDLSRLDKETVAEIQEGTVWPVYILQPSDREGNLIVSVSRAIQEKDWLVAQQMMDNNEILEAKVSGHNNGGLEVVFGKLRGFVPASHISTLPRGVSTEERKALLSSLVGQTIPLKVVEVDRRKRRLILSERAAHRRWQREHRKQLLDEIEIGEVRTGTVRSLANFGAFVDLGGAEGLIHVSEIAWFPVTHPSEVLRVGERVDVKVLRIDKQRERVGLSLKRVQPDPWSHVQEDYKSGELVEAVVTRVTDFGAFVRLRTGVEGLLHVSEMADIRPDHPQSLVSPGDLLLLRVIRVEPDRRRIGLSLRQVSETEWAEWAASYRERHAQPAEAEAELETVEALEQEAAEDETAAMALESEAADELVAVEDLRAEAEGAEAAAVDLEEKAAAEAALAEALVSDAEAKLAAASALEREAASASAEADELATDLDVKLATASALETEAEEAVEKAGALAVSDEMKSEEQEADELAAGVDGKFAAASALETEPEEAVEEAGALAVSDEMKSEEQEADELAAGVDGKFAVASALESEPEEAVEEAGASAVSDEASREKAALAAVDAEAPARVDDSGGNSKLA
jgi:small subunit ribosomal protein S1